jgi:hypothetical protein
VTEHRGGDRARVTARRVRDATPRRSSRSSLAFTLDTGAPAPAVSGSRLATLVTAHIARAFGGDRGRATAEAVARVSRTLGATGWRRWSPPERRAFERLAMLVGLIPDRAVAGAGSRTAPGRDAGEGRRERGALRRLRESLQALVRDGSAP